MRRLFALALVATLALVACGAGAPADPAAPSAPAASGAPASSASSSSVPAPAQVTLANENGTITMRVGQTFTLALGATQVWTVQVADQTVLRRLVNDTMVRGAQGIYQALQAGTTTLSASGRPQCGAGQACPMYIVEFQVTVVVSA